MANKDVLLSNRAGAMLRKRYPRPGSLFNLLVSSYLSQTAQHPARFSSTAWIHSNPHPHNVALKT